jgi:hypothetical protein
MNVDPVRRQRIIAAKFSTNLCRQSGIRFFRPTDRGDESGEEAHAIERVQHGPNVLVAEWMREQNHSIQGSSDNVSLPGDDSYSRAFSRIGIRIDWIALLCEHFERADVFDSSFGVRSRKFEGNSKPNHPVCIRFEVS